MDDQNKNTILAIVLSVVVLIAWQMLYVNPKIEKERQATDLQAQQEQTVDSSSVGGETSGQSHSRSGGGS